MQVEQEWENNYKLIDLEMQIEQEEENNYTIEKSQEKRFSCKGCANLWWSEDIEQPIIIGG